MLNEEQERKNSLAKFHKQEQIEEILDCLINYELDQQLVDELEIRSCNERDEELIKQTIQYVKEEASDDLSTWEYAVRRLAEELVKAKRGYDY